MKKTTHVEDFQDLIDNVADSEEDVSDDNADPEAREQALAEQSESDDEVLASMEARGDTDALGARLAAEASVQPAWSQRRKGKALQIRVTSDDENEQATETSQVGQRKEKSNNVGEKKATGLSKTEQRAQQEASGCQRPVFKTPALNAGHVHSMITTSSLPALPAPATTTGKSSVPAPPAPTTISAPPIAQDDSDSTESDSDLEMVDGIQPHDYRVVYPAQGGPLSLKAQHPDIQDAIQATITRFERKILFEDAFPDAHRRGRGVRQTMVETVRDLIPREKFRSLLTRLITDARFLKSLASIPNQRISSFRGKIKDKSNVAVASFFRLVPGEAKERVEWLLPHLAYVYPTDFEKRQVTDSQPYRAPIVVNILRESFFKGAKSFYNRNEVIFMSSLPGRVEREIPLTMLALVGAAIHASLIDWRSGDCVEASPFSADRYLDAYTEHKILLNEIKKSAPMKYHTMMYKLFDEASAGPVHIAPLGASAIAHLNLDAMEED